MELNLQSVRNRDVTLSGLQHGVVMKSGNEICVTAEMRDCLVL
jgi:hypothetical protein